MALLVVLAATGLGTTADAVSLHSTLEVRKAGTGSGRVTSVPPLLNCGPTCFALVPGSDEPEPVPIVLRATPDPGSVFVRWIGACDGTNPSCTLEVLFSEVVTAVFDRSGRRTSHPLAVGRSGNGTVTSAPGGINCGSSCAASFASGTAVTLTAAPGPGSAFTGWSGACTGADRTCLVVVHGATTVSAVFDGAAAPTFPLAVGKVGTGTVTSTPAGISCGSRCAASFPRGAQVTLRARAGGRSRFVGWSGACVVTTPTCAVTLDDAKSVTAQFRDVVDTVAPVVKALASSGKRGQVVRLRYRVSDDSGSSREDVVVLRGKRRLATIRGRLDTADNSVLFYFARWRVPRSTPRGALRFCVRGIDAAGNRSKESCAALRIS